MMKWSSSVAALIVVGLLLVLLAGAPRHPTHAHVAVPTLPDTPTLGGTIDTLQATYPTGRVTRNGLTATLTPLGLIAADGQVRVAGITLSFDQGVADNAVVPFMTLFAPSDAQKGALVLMGSQQIAPGHYDHRGSSAILAQTFMASVFFNGGPDQLVPNGGHALLTTPGMFSWYCLIDWCYLALGIN